MLPLKEPFCQLCGLPLINAGLCRSCKEERPAYTQLRSWLAYEGPIRSALHNLKYSRDMALGEALAFQFQPYLMSLGWQVDMVVPVPLGRQRRMERGYNQTAMLALPLSAMAGWEYDPTALKRSRETRSQVGLTVSERKNNVTGAFCADKKKVDGKAILVMDDVATTGATLSACARTLKEAGTREVFAFTLGRAMPHQGLRSV